jgi:hypothetical protein
MTPAYDILPPPLFDGKNLAAALSSVADKAEHLSMVTATSATKVDGRGGKIGRHNGGGGGGITDFTSSDCGAVPTGWRLQQSLTPTSSSSHQSTSGHQQLQQAAVDGSGPVNNSSSPSSSSEEQCERKKDGGPAKKSTNMNGRCF